MDPTSKLPFPTFPPDTLRADDPRLSGRTLQLFGSYFPGTPAIIPFRLLDAGDGKCPPTWWTVQLHARELEREGVAPGLTPVAQGAIRAANPSTIYKARISWQDRSGGGPSSGRQIEVDIAAGLTLQIGPAQRLNVDVLGFRTVDMPEDHRGTIQVPNTAVPIPVGNVRDTLVSASAGGYPLPSGVRHARLSQVVLAAAAENPIVQVPAAAWRAHVYMTPGGVTTTPELLAITVPAPVSIGAMEKVVGVAGSLPAAHAELPGDCKAIQLGAAGFARVYSVVFDLEF